MPRSIVGLLSCALALLAAPGLPASASAQEVGVFASGGWSDQTTLRRPVGYGGYAAVHLFPVLKVRLGYAEQRDGERRDRTVCDSYWPAFENCGTESVRSTARLRTVSALAIVTAPVAPRVWVELGGGVARNRVELDVRTPSGRGLGLFVPEGEDQPGVVLHAALAMERVLGMPLGAVLELGGQEVDFDGCAMDVGTPYCGTSQFREVRVGLRHRFF